MEQSDFRLRHDLPHILLGMPRSLVVIGALTLVKHPPTRYSDESPLSAPFTKVFCVELEKRQTGSQDSEKKRKEMVVRVSDQFDQAT